MGVKWPQWRGRPRDRTSARASERGSLLFDKPIASRIDDTLGRAGFAETAARIVLTTPGDDSLRVGIYGEWGEGKTSVLALISTSVEAAGHLPIWFTPWPASSGAELRIKLIRSVCTALGVGITQLKAAGAAATVVRGTRAIGREWSTKLQRADAVFGSHVQSAIDGAETKYAQRLVPAILDKAAGRKIVILVDDLDRIRPELLPDFLLTLKEGLDLPGFRYVLGLDATVVDRGLRGLHAGWADAGSFLEKIVEYPLHLPRVRKEQLDRFIKAEIDRVRTPINRDALEQISDVLPRNPRRCKAFLRYVAGTSAITSRFHPSELGIEAFYLGQLMWFEAADALRMLVNDENALKELQSAVFSKYSSDKKKQTDPLSRVRAYAEHSPNPQRFNRLCDALVEQSSFVSGLNVTDMLTLIEQPPLFTWKETEELATRFEAAAPEARAQLLSGAISDSGSPSAERTRELFRRVLAWHERAFEHAVDQDLYQDVVRELSSVHSSLDVIQVLVKELSVFETGLAEGSTWLVMQATYAKYSTWATTTEYREIRDREVVVLEEATRRLPKPTREGLLEDLLQRRSFDDHHDRVSPAVRQIIDGLFHSTALERANELVDLFQTGDFATARHQGDSNPDMWLLFDKDSTFHQGPTRSKLLRILRSQSHDKNFATNAAEYFSALAYTATGNTRLRSEDAVAILRTDGLGALLWHAAISVRLNRRTFGSMRELRDKLVETHDLSASDFPLPKWAEDGEA